MTDPSSALPRDDSRLLYLESLDGSVSIPLNVDAEHLLLPGATGLDLPPLSVVTAQTPGIPGTWLQEVDVLQRPVFLPLEFTSETSQADFFDTLAALRGVVAGWEQVTLGSTGTFRLRVTSASGERVLTVVYSSGMEGSWGSGDGGTKWQKYGLNLIAVDPYWRAPEATQVVFTAQAPNPFITSSAGTTYPWPRQIMSDFSVIGAGMPVTVGEIPAWPVIEVDGPSSALEVVWAGTNINVSALTTGQTLLLKTDPRGRSARINGQPAWSAISMSSVISALPPGDSEIDIAGSPQRVSLTWTPGFKSAW